LEGETVLNASKRGGALEADGDVVTRQKNLTHVPWEAKRGDYIRKEPGRGFGGKAGGTTGETLGRKQERREAITGHL